MIRLQIKTEFLIWKDENSTQFFTLTSSICNKGSEDNADNTSTVSKYNEKFNLDSDRIFVSETDLHVILKHVFNFPLKLSSGKKGLINPLTDLHRWHVPRY